MGGEREREREREREGERERERERLRDELKLPVSPVTCLRSRLYQVTSEAARGGVGRVK